jgi:predicted transcriptional regulator
MTTRDKIIEYLRPLPPHKTTIPEIAFKLGVSRVGVATSVRELEMAGRLKIADRKKGRWTIYQVLESMDT